ncbi:hypothetical protein GCM10027262_45980 [Nocardia tengchongensis]
MRVRSADGGLGRSEPPRKRQMRTSGSGALYPRILLKCECSCRCSELVKAVDEFFQGVAIFVMGWAVATFGGHYDQVPCS